MASFLRITSCLLLFLAAAAQAEDRPGAPNTQLIFAATSGSAADVQAAVARGADPNHANDDGTPALSLAAARKDGSAVAVVTALLDAKADPNREDNNGQTPLFYAARKGQIPVMTLLLQRGVDFYHADHNGLRARDAAYKENQMDMLAAMDKFMQDKTTDVMQQYKERNQQLEERNKAIETGNAALVERNKQLDARNAQPEKPRLAKPAPTPPAAVDKTRLLALTHDLSYHACGAEYWRFLRLRHQETGLSREQMKAEGEAHQAQAAEATEAIKKEFHANDAYTDKIATPSGKQIDEQLAAPITNAGRKSEGMGTKDDMDERCGDIADQWEIGRAAARQAQPASAGGGVSDK